mmetsp:Transcript_49829/g.107915  ORF Transcript_49829/g.107915 Transcript_49829/m.107915 type:complete len:297 (-) Transcript_49829:811-1701(-)
MSHHLICHLQLLGQVHPLEQIAQLLGVDAAVLVDVELLKKHRGVVREVERARFRRRLRSQAAHTPHAFRTKRTHCTTPPTSTSFHIDRRSSTCPLPKTARSFRSTWLRAVAASTIDTCIQTTTSARHPCVGHDCQSTISTQTRKVTCVSHVHIQELNLVNYATNIDSQTRAKLALCRLPQARADFVNHACRPRTSSTRCKMIGCEHHDSSSHWWSIRCESILIVEPCCVSQSRLSVWLFCLVLKRCFARSMRSLSRIQSETSTMRYSSSCMSMARPLVCSTSLSVMAASKRRRMRL